MELKKFEGQIKEELSLIEVAYAILEEKGEAIDFTQLLLDIQSYLEVSDEFIEAKMIRFYTDLNIDGRFISVGDNRWGLRSWYAVDEIDEEIITSSEEEASKRRKKKSGKVNAFADNEEDMIDYNDDDPEDSDDSYVYDEDEDEEVEEDEEDEPIEILVADVEEDEPDEDEELNEYATDLSELGDEEIDLDEEEDFEEEDDDLEDEELEED
ncbi:DNA-directed RNA polymerase subunit delta [Facklamia sp. 7083-14-GEN3]|uniref:DNA-directed RNA polymerase subunit delta n=1 Tax=Facklamia sp. 7083-14-GEN3 TaxID=2973478 RepID=UPI00215CC236|nr:DNA-directed RNA polymerase subunit delta [Facklamia sp. 7083-14-GEN3]MCR8969953.1 DNA-directed RNA polymerase subunit delta [Facklamia sp. 7083-14-GEN3]